MYALVPFKKSVHDTHTARKPIMKSAGVAVEVISYATTPT